jgi:hypothetical protein
MKTSQWTRKWISRGLSCLWAASFAIVGVSIASPAQAAGDDVFFTLASGGSTRLILNGATVSVGMTGGSVGLAASDTPCTTDPDGAQICGYTVNRLAVRLTNFTASGTTFVNPVVQLVSPVAVTSHGGTMTIPAGTPMAFGATVGTTREFSKQNAPSAITLIVDLAAQTATVKSSFVGTMQGNSVDAGIIATAVRPFVNLPPIANAGPDFTVQGHGPFVAVPLSGSASDPGGGALASGDWRENGVVVAQGFTATALLPPGTHTLTLYAYDTFGAHGTDTVVVQVAPGSYIGPVGHRLDYFYCAGENQTCVIGGSKYVAYGANGSYVYKAVTGSVSCSTATFGSDPAVGVVKSCYFANFGLVTGEGSSSTAPAAGYDIAFGANGVFNFGRVTGSFFCGTGTFGDPLPGVTKACYRAVPDYGTPAVAEFGTLTGLNNTPVAFGANGQYVFKLASGTVTCGNATFGYDPKPGYAKTCYVASSLNGPLGPPIADEFQNFTFSGQVDYTSGLNGNILFVRTSGAGGCNNGTFGGDPDVGMTKHCYGLPVIQ